MNASSHHSTKESYSTLTLTLTLTLKRSLTLCFEEIEIAMASDEDAAAVLWEEIDCANIRPVRTALLSAQGSSFHLIRWSEKKTSSIDKFFSRHCSIFVFCYARIKYRVSSLRRRLSSRLFCREKRGSSRRVWSTLTSAFLPEVRSNLWHVSNGFTVRSVLIMLNGNEYSDLAIVK